MLIATTDIPLSVEVGPPDVLVLSSDATTRVVWLEASTIRSLELVSNLTAKPTSVSGSAYSRIVDISLQSRGHFVAQTANGTSRILKLEVDKLKAIWEFPDSVSTIIQNSFLALLMR